jgi:hypothetical protein
MRSLSAHFTPQGARWTEEQLNALANATGTGGRRGFTGGAGPVSGFADEHDHDEQPPFAGGGGFAFAGQRLQFFREEGVAAILTPGRGDGGTVFVQQASVATGPKEQRVAAQSPQAKGRITPQFALAAEHYNRLMHMVQAKEKVKLAIDLKAVFEMPDKGMSFNTVAEIPGTDKKDEIVMCGGHLDSWHGGTGTTDNAAGVTVCMEAVRILQALGVRPRRTIRFACWTGEEQGIFGSAAYVAEHFGTKQQPKAEYEKISGYFNLDNGTGKIRGVWCQGNEAIKPIFAEWLKPFADLGATTVTSRSTGGTDHLPFDRVGIPGFQFIQDTIEYDSRTHHSNMDTFDRAQLDDLRQAAILMAAFLYNTAMREERLPRK